MGDLLINGYSFCLGWLKKIGNNGDSCTKLWINVIELYTYNGWNDKIYVIYLTTIKKII